jgi:hypothetical protein
MQYLAEYWDFIHAMITLAFIFLYFQNFWTYKEWAIKDVLKRAKKNGKCPICQKPLKVETEI